MGFVGYEQSISHKSRLRLFYNLQQFHFKHQRRSGRNGTAIDITIGEIRRNEQSPFASYCHQLERFRPATDNLAEGKSSGLIVGIRAFKNPSVDERTGIMT